MPTGARTDPFKAYNFQLEIGSLVKAQFQEVSGLDTSSESIEYRVGSPGKELWATKQPGLTKYANIVCKRGIAADTDLTDWRQKVIDGKVERQNGSVHLLDDTGNKKVSWDFEGAFPIKLSGPSLNSTSNMIAIETLEFVVEKVTRKAG